MTHADRPAICIAKEDLSACWKDKRVREGERERERERKLKRKAKKSNERDVPLKLELFFQGWPTLRKKHILYSGQKIERFQLCFV